MCIDIYKQTNSCGYKHDAPMYIYILYINLEYTYISMSVSGPYICPVYIYIDM